MWSRSISVTYSCCRNTCDNTSPQLVWAASQPALQQCPVQSHFRGLSDRTTRGFPHLYTTTTTTDSQAVEQVAGLCHTPALRGRWPKRQISSTLCKILPYTVSGETQVSLRQPGEVGRTGIVISSLEMSKLRFQESD